MDTASSVAAAVYARMMWDCALVVWIGYVCCKTASVVLRLTFDPMFAGWP
jgi:hypothetical protein